jgi:hypothetical protein
MPNSKKINLNDKKIWSEFDWSDPVVPLALKKTDSQVNIARANRLKANDPKIKAKLSDSTQKVLADPAKVKIRNEAAHRGGLTKSNSIKYQELMTQVNREKAKNPEFANNVRKGIKDKWEDPEYRAKQEKAKEVRMKPCTNGKGEVFPSRTYAAKAYNVDPRVMGNWIKKGKDGWRYL